MTREQIVTETPTALANITADMKYAIQNRTQSTNVFVAVASAVPAAGDASFVIPSHGFLYAQAAASDDVYVWRHSEDQDGLVTYEESP